MVFQSQLKLEGGAQNLLLHKEGVVVSSKRYFTTSVLTILLTTITF